MISVIVGTETGTAEFVSDDIVSLLENHDLTAEATLEPNTDILESSKTWIVCTSTHGAGDIPNNLQQFYTWLESTKPDLSELKFMVIGLGDSNYDRYCGAADTLFDTLKDLNAQPLTDVFKVDAMSEELPEDLIIPYLEQQIPLFK